MSYNGWRNYETWVTKLWIDNDQGAQEYAYEIARRETDRTDTANALKAWIEEETPTVTGLFADLLSTALGKVDWYEIADAYLEEVADEDEPAEGAT
jgi:hypothetical protein